MDNEEKVKKHTIKKIIAAVFTIIFAVVSAGAIYGYAQLSKIKTTEISKTDGALGIDTKSTQLQAPGDSIINIALFGIDTGREKYEAAHSDAIMILTIDEKHKKLKLSSIMRDSYVSVENHGKTKITNAYAYGGPQLTIKTLNQNFNLDIRDYVTVDFKGLSNIIDSLGGVEVNVAQNEISEVNKYMEEVASITKEKPTPVVKAGEQLLNGNQAVAYARIRHVGNGDFERTERQSDVLQALITKIEQQGPSKYIQIASKLLPYVETSMSPMDIVKTGAGMVASGATSLEWIRFPLDGYWKAETINKIWYLGLNIPATTNQLHQFIYDDVKP